jgi:DNA-binding transcriptional MocR family regulator
LEKKRRLLELARKHNFYILEDGSLEDLIPPSLRQKSLKSMDAGNIVIHMRTYSRLTGMRLGFMTLPGKRQSPRSASETLPPAISQKAFAHFIQSGDLDECAARIRASFTEKLKAAQAAVDAFLADEAFYFKAKSGVNLWLSLKGLKDPQALHLRIAQRNVIIIPGSVYSEDNSFMSLCLSGVDRARIAEGVRIIAEERKRLGS